MGGCVSEQEQIASPVPRNSGLLPAHHQQGMQEPIHPEPSAGHGASLPSEPQAAKGQALQARADNLKKGAQQDLIEAEERAEEARKLEQERKRSEEREKKEREKLEKREKEQSKKKRKESKSKEKFLLSDLFAQEQVAEAEEKKKKAEEPSDNSFEYFYNRAKKLSSSGQKEEAIEAYLEAIKADPKRGKAYFGLGMVYRDKRQFEQTVKWFRKAVRFDKDNVLYHQELAHWLRYTGQQTEAMKQLKEVVRLEPKKQLALSNYASGYFGMGQHSRSYTLFRKMLTLNRENTDPYVHFQVFLTVNQTQTEQIRLVASLEDLVKQHPGCKKAQDSLKLMYKELGKHFKVPKGFNIAKKPANLEPKDAEGMFELAVWLEADGSFEEALQKYKEVVSVNPKHEQALFIIGHLYDDQRNKQEAQAYYRKVLEINPEHNEANYGLLVCVGLKGDWEEVKTIAEGILRRDPYHAQAVTQMAMYYTAMQDEKGGLVFEKKKVELRPYKSTSYQMMVYTAAQKQKETVDEIIAFLRSMKEKDPQNDNYESSIATIKRMWGEENPKGKLSA